MARTLKGSSAFLAVDEEVRKYLDTINRPIDPGQVANNYGEAMAFVAGARYIWETFLHGELLEGAIEALKHLEAEEEAEKAGKGPSHQES